MLPILENHISNLYLISMKNKILFLNFFVLLFVPIVIVSCTEIHKHKAMVPPDEIVATRSGNDIWDFPVKPGMAEWCQLKSMDEMYQVCQIPDNILRNIDTKSLTDICLNFPAPPVFPLFNTPHQGFMEYYSNFNGIRELFTRNDAGMHLFQKYVEMSLSAFEPDWPLYKQGQFISRYKFIESILSQPQVVATLDLEEQKTLLHEAVCKIDEKISRTDLFSGFSIEMNLWVIGRLLSNEVKLALEEHDYQKFQIALQTGMFVDVDVDMLYQLAKTSVYENE